MKYLKAILIILVLFTGCNDSRDITSAMAENLVEDYLEHNSMYETSYFNTRKMKLRSNKDTVLIAAIQRLEEDGYVDLMDVKSRKKWFSKDSVYTITPTLTQQALPYVIDQGKNRTEVKTLAYELDRTQDVKFEKKNKKMALFNVVLLKNKTPFYAFGEDNNPNSEFITRKFKAKYKEETGWYLVE